MQTNENYFSNFINNNSLCGCKVNYNISFNLTVNYNLSTYIYHSYYNKTVLTRSPNMTVANPPPMNPSQVFLGDSFMRGVLPKKNPKRYAQTSLHTIIETGTINLRDITKLSRFRLLQG